MQASNNAINSFLSERYKTLQKTQDNAQNDKKKLKINMDDQFSCSIQDTSFNDIGGIDDLIFDLTTFIENPLNYTHLFKNLGVEPTKAILLHGPPGCGKTKLGRAISGQFNIPLFYISAPELISSLSGGSEAKLRELFECAKNAAPCIIFIDEIDSITPKRDYAPKEMEKRIVSQLISCIDDINNEYSTQTGFIYIIGATSRIDSIDQALRRPGRFEKEIHISIPCERRRLQILSKLLKKISVDSSLDLCEIANISPGYVAADLAALVRESCTACIQRTKINIDSDHQICLNRLDFEMALTKVKPSLKREGFIQVTNVNWNQIGALEEVRHELQISIIDPIKHKNIYQKFGISLSSGILLWGPPGCGKTLLAKVIASETRCNFISVKGPELLNKYVGESERAIREIFDKARASAPCIIFFDEIDAICPKRTENLENYSSRMVNQLLTEMDGINERKSVYLLAATNRPDMIDTAILRPGRLDKSIYVKLPSEEERYKILKAVSHMTPWATNIDLVEIASDPRCERFSGADIAAFVKECTVLAINDYLHTSNCSAAGATFQQENSIFIEYRHIEKAFSKIKPSISREQALLYEKIFDLSLT